MLKCVKKNQQFKFNLNKKSLTSSFDINILYLFNSYFYNYFLNNNLIKNI